MASRNASFTIGVLTPYAGGFYYGAVLAAIHGAARLRGARVVALHTVGLDLHWPGEREPAFLALDVADAWIAINGFDSPDFASRIIEANLPLVYLSERPAELACCSILPDNREGARVATLHLIDHGHRRIGFMGFLDQYDVRERYEGYLDAHRDRGLPTDPSLLFAAQGAMEIAGEEIGAKLVESGMPCTAMVAATDKSALGMIPVLHEAGYEVPRDFAVVGFDDIEKAQYANPPLTTVRQRFDRLGAIAAETLLDHLQHGAALPEVIRVPSMFIRRVSCGCRPRESLAPPRILPTHLHPADALERALLEAAGKSSLSVVAAQAWSGARRIADAVFALSQGSSELDRSALVDAWDGFLAISRDVESIEGVIAILEAYSEAWLQSDTGGLRDAAAHQRVQVGLRQLRIDLMRQWRIIEQASNRDCDYAAEANTRINLTLTGQDFADARSLTWLRWTRVQYGNLGLWSETTEQSTRQLQIVSEYGKLDLAATLLDTLHRPARFPPPLIQKLVEHFGDDNIVMVVPIRGHKENRGLLTVIGPIETDLLDHVGNVYDWATLIGSSLEREDVEGQLRNHIVRDSLTGLPNRALLMERLERLIATDRNSIDQRFAVLVFDLDDFKSINDSLGHLIGDRLLVDFTLRLQSCLRDTDTIARLGGDEFAVLVQNVVHENDALAVAARIHEALRAPFSLAGDSVFTSCSLGVVLSTPQHASAADLLRDADTAMYRAKVQGRARSAVFDRDMHTQAVERLHLDSRLRQALERGEFELYYQPLISLHTNCPVGAEALIRWNHPERGCLSPARFLSVAEEVGLAIPISKWVIDSACREAATWQSTQAEPFYVNVNVPAQHFKDPNFVKLVLSTLERYNLPPAALGLELVESSLIEHPEATSKVLEQLRSLGVKTAIDDFGTGYSSLSYLKLLPLSVLKLDRGFIQGIPDDAHDAAITSAIITMAHGLGLTVVAEGVESIAQARFLRAKGCDLLQGFLLSVPLPADECRRYLASGGQPDLVLRATA